MKRGIKWAPFPKTAVSESVHPPACVFIEKSARELREEIDLAQDMADKGFNADVATGIAMALEWVLNGGEPPTERVKQLLMGAC